MTRNRKRTLTIGLLAAHFFSPGNFAPTSQAATAPSTAEETEPPAFVAWPEKGPGLVIDLAGFTKEIDQVKPDGRRYLMASHPHTGVHVSVTLEKVPTPASIQGCVDQLHQIRKNPLVTQGQDLTLNAAGETPTLEYLLREFQGSRIDQKNIYVCLAQGNVYADIHLSKMQYAEADAPLFQSILKTIRLQQEPPPPEPAIPPQPPMVLTSRQLFTVGRELYLENLYVQAIPPYQKALDLEKDDPQLDRTLWRILIDNLGMAYGMAGQFKEAKATFEQGIESDPTYPMFHYNLACIFADMNDINHAMQSLKTAFRYRKNQTPGDTDIPDPRQSASFQRFMKNNRFRAVVESLTETNS